MGVKLKQNLRKDLRVQVERSLCYIKAVNSDDVYSAEVSDLSVGGLSFYMDQVPFQDRSLVEVKLMGLNGNAVIFLSMIRSVASHQSSQEFRFSARFDRKLSEKEFQTLIKNLALVVRETKSA